MELFIYLYLIPLIVSLLLFLLYFYLEKNTEYFIFGNWYSSSFKVKEIIAHILLIISPAFNIGAVFFSLYKVIDLIISDTIIRPKQNTWLSKVNRWLNKIV